jgi:hypothetical protein
VENRPQFRGLNLIHKLENRLKKLSDIIDYTTCKRYLDMTEKPQLGWRLVMTVWRMSGSHENISFQKLF